MFWRERVNSAWLASEVQPGEGFELATAAEPEVRALVVIVLLTPDPTCVHAHASTERTTAAAAGRQSLPITLDTGFTLEEALGVGEKEGAAGCASGERARRRERYAEP
jgi:hypothetical protein